MYRYFCSALIAIVLTTGCVKIQNAYQVVPPGVWRATLDLTSDAGADEGFDEYSGGQLPFNFDVIYDTQDSFHIEIVNGDERIEITDISYGRDIATGRDTIQINFPVFDSYIRADYEEDAIEGYWYAPNRGDYKIEFRAYHGKTERFDLGVQDPNIDVSGRWKVSFRVETNDPYSAIGIFEQNDSELTGTFMTRTGDYRYLAGNVGEDRMYLSTFDGAHAYLFEAKLLEDGTLTGVYRSGIHYKTYWTAVRDSNFRLASPDSLTVVTDPAKPINFNLQTPNGKTITLDQPPFANRPKIVILMGTWCPNCRDLTEFLKNYLSEHPAFDIPIVALAFERYREKDRALEMIETYKSRFDLPYEIVYGGSSDKTEAAQHIPGLDRVVAYPTILFLDEKNRIIRSHTGFAGPATAEYDDFREKFHNIVTSL